MFENLGEKLNGVFKKLRGQGSISESNIKDALRDVRLALLEADANYKVVKEFTDRVKAKALGEDVLTSVKPGQQFVKIVHDELVEMMGGREQTFALPEGKKRAIIMLLGLQGSGKTTFSGKLATRFLKEKRKPMLVACDIYRPAAIKQLEVVGSAAGVPVFQKGQIDPVLIADGAFAAADATDRDLMIFDTAGRLHIDEVKMDELVALKARIQPDYVFLVADAMTGQDAVNSAEAFNSAIGIDGVCLTKMDGDARGGAALSIKSITGKPIVFIGTGEKAEDLEYFRPDGIVNRMLGMGDVVQLVERAQEVFDEQEAEALQKKMRRQTFTLTDFLSQLQKIKKMGSVTKLMGLIPGLGANVKNLDISDKDFARIEAMILSMTPKERENPEIIGGTRRKRIAKGSGTGVEDVNGLLRQFEQMKKMMSSMVGMMNPFGGMKGALPAGAGGGEEDGGMEDFDPATGLQMSGGMQRAAKSAFTGRAMSTSRDFQKKKTKVKAARQQRKKNRKK